MLQRILLILLLILTTISFYLFSMKVDIFPWGNSSIDGLYLLAFIYLIPVYFIILIFSIYKKIDHKPVTIVTTAISLVFLIICISETGLIIGALVCLGLIVFLIFKFYILR